jgi:hypothetical protein
MPIDHERINLFISENQFRQNLANVIRRAGFQITWIRYTGSPLMWGFYIKPNQPMKDLFSINKEVLLWVAEFDEYQIRSVSQAIDIVVEDVRLSDQFIIVVTGDPDTPELVGQLA